MATFYSSFFSSGLRQQDPPSPSTPKPSNTGLPADPFEETTPTGAPFTQHTPTSPSTLLPSAAITHTAHDDSRPRLRRRRSSLSTAASPVTTFKSSGSMRQATNAQRQSILRSRSGSDASVLSLAAAAATRPTAGEAPPQQTSIIGRLRSGSVGTALRCAASRLFRGQLR